MSKTISVLSLEFSCIELIHNSMNNLLSYCGLVDAKIRASDKDLPVQVLRALFPLLTALLIRQDLLKNASECIAAALLPKCGALEHSPPSLF